MSHCCILQIYDILFYKESLLATVLNVILNVGISGCDELFFLDVGMIKVQWTSQEI